MSIQKRTWFVTGSSRGLGRALVEEALKSGDNVIATARDKATVQDLIDRYPESALVLPVDVTIPAQVQAAVEQAVARFGQIDVVFNNAGYGLLGAVEEATDSQIREQFETNFFGLLNVTRAVLPTFREQGHGHFLQVSTAVSLGLPSLGIYGASKLAVEGASESLAAEVNPLGIKVTIIKPGGYQTDWLSSSMVMAEAQDAYAPTAGYVRDLRNTINADPEQYLGDPALFAQALMHVVALDNPPLRLSLGQDSLDAMRQKLAAQSAELEQWSTLSTYTNLAEYA